VTGGCRRLHNMELRNVYSLRNINRMVKPRTRREVYVARIGEKSNLYN
jgi:hypothetical protein